MTMHYHCTPITPNSVMEMLAGRNFCVSFARPDQVQRAHEIGQSVMLDNGAYTIWKDNGARLDADAYHAWAKPWLDCPTTWAVIPDMIDGKESLNDELVLGWPFGRDRGAPVWHLNEPYERLVRLACRFPRVCFGSAGAYSSVGSDAWSRRVRGAFSALMFLPSLPWIHMLRGMAVSGSKVFPFASVDSSNIARHHHEPQNDAVQMAQRLDSRQCTIRWDNKEQYCLGVSDEERLADLEKENGKLTTRVSLLESTNRKLTGADSYTPPTKEDQP